MKKLTKREIKNLLISIRSKSQKLFLAGQMGVADLQQVETMVMKGLRKLK